MSYDTFIMMHQESDSIIDVRALDLYNAIITTENIAFGVPKSVSKAMTAQLHLIQEMLD